MSRRILGMGRIRLAWLVLREAREMMAEEEQSDQEEIVAAINNREADPTSYDAVVQAVGFSLVERFQGVDRFQPVGEFDWTAFFEFLMRILPLILPLLI